MYKFMKNNIREYHTLRFLRGRKRNNAEMQRLADSGQDFEYRRLLIEENELDLHIFFSWMTVFNWLAWGFLALALSSFQFPMITSVFLGLAIISRVSAFKYKKKFQYVFRCYILALAVVDCVIRQDHGIS
jgi:hypothetical protein